MQYRWRLRLRLREALDRVGIWESGYTACPCLVRPFDCLTSGLGRFIRTRFGSLFCGEHSSSSTWFGCIVHSFILGSSQILALVYLSLFRIMGITPSRLQVP